MAGKSVARWLLGGGWVTLIAFTALAYWAPFVPCRSTALLLLGVANGRYLARWV